MTDASAQPHRRELLGWAQSVVKTPQWHSRAAVWEACDVMIRFGSLDDIATVLRLRAAIEAGEVRPGAAAARRRRWIKVAILANVVVWTLALVFGALADAQSAGLIPSIVEMIR